MTKPIATMGLYQGIKVITLLTESTFRGARQHIREQFKYMPVLQTTDEGECICVQPVAGLAMDEGERFVKHERPEFLNDDVHWVEDMNDYTLTPVSWEDGYGSHIVSHYPLNNILPDNLYELLCSFDKDGLADFRNTMTVTSYLGYKTRPGVVGGGRPECLPEWWPFDENPGEDCEGQKSNPDSTVKENDQMKAITRIECVSYVSGPKNTDTDPPELVDNTAASRIDDDARSLDDFHDNWKRAAQVSSQGDIRVPAQLAGTTFTVELTETENGRGLLLTPCTVVQKSSIPEWLWEAIQEYTE